MAREEAALGLVREMLGYEGREAARDAAAAEQRMAAARLDAADADAELARAQAEGPASHRKRDYIDKARAALSSRPPPALPLQLAGYGGATVVMRILVGTRALGLQVSSSVGLPAPKDALSTFK